ncbi:glucosidase II beta subunit-like protein-domain-containing protein [Phyllosticta citrichinensis]|uniref:Endoplasmic reticulum lectin n=1 Tax=Phyllosticta citrichinensis TaxID=1130410 RepID=A0ABR1Y2W3_9PEZI
MMKQLWALPALMRLVLASPGSFSVLDDLLAFPQYHIRFLDGSISDEHAKSLYLSSKAADTPNSAISNGDISQQPRQDDGVPVGATDPFRSSHQGEQDHDDELSATYERLVLHSRPYLCRIPIVDTAGNRSAGNVTQSAADEEKELSRATDRGWELLKGMQGNCIYFLSGWWSYSFCYNEGVKQFHQLPPSRGVPIYPPVEDESVGSYILGRFPDDGKRNGKVESEADEANVDDEGNSKGVKKDGEKTAVARMETKGESRYLVQKLTGGTTCDLTGKDRKIEVQFHCHPNTPDRIGMIKEVATCSYLMVIYTPRLCNDVAFIPPQENRAHAISCAPIASPGSPPGATLPSAVHHRAESAVEKAAKPEFREASIRLPPALAAAASGPQATSRPLPTVGGTVVGAKQLVGQPGSRIEKSVVVGGGKETMLGTVASSDGRGKEKVMTPEQLRKLDIKNPRDVDDLKKELGKMAGNRAWRLILIDTPHGREFRGIIDTEDDEGDGKASSKSKDKSRGKDDADAKKKNRNDGERAPRQEGDEDEWEWEFEEWFDWGEGEEDPDREGDNEGSQEELYREDF